MTTVLYPSLSWPRALRASVALSLLFLLVYGATNHYVATLDVTATFAWEWERRIPFVPWMLLPYVSLHAAFALAPLLCRTEAELRRLIHRLLGILIPNTAAFLVFPLRFAFERPRPDGLIGELYKLLHAADPPHNLAPSQHITMLCVLMTVYLPRTRRPLRPLTWLWAAVVAASTLLTWQHHVIDVTTGLALGLTVIALVRR